MSDAIYDFWNFVVQGTLEVFPDIARFVFFCTFFVMAVFLLFIMMGTSFYAASLMIGWLVEFFRWIGSFSNSISTTEGASEAIETLMDTSAIVAAKEKDEKALFQIGIEGPQKKKQSDTRSRSRKGKK
jgi:ABC-type multidrug transport system fused ATPase/permease subunit